MVNCHRVLVVVLVVVHSVCQGPLRAKDKEICFSFTQLSTSDHMSISIRHEDHEWMSHPLMIIMTTKDLSDE